MRFPNLPALLLAAIASAPSPAVSASALHAVAPNSTSTFTTTTTTSSSTPPSATPTRYAMSCGGGLDYPCLDLCRCSGASVNCHADPTSRCAVMCTCKAEV